MFIGKIFLLVVAAKLLKNHGTNVFLAGKEIRSDLYKRELKMLVDMDCALQLIELQNVTLPREPPPVPPLPPGFGVKPVVPPKTDSLLRKIKKKTSVVASV